MVSLLRIEKARVTYHEKAASATGNAERQRPQRAHSAGEGLQVAQTSEVSIGACGRD